MDRETTNPFSKDSSYSNPKNMDDRTSLKDKSGEKSEKFPPELERKIYHGFEPRYFIILLSSLFLHIVLALYLSTYLSVDDKGKSVEKVRKQFARLLLEGKDLSPSVETEESESERFTNFDILDTFLKEIDNYEPGLEGLLDLPESKAGDVDIEPSKRTRANRNQIQQRRQNSRDELVDDVEHIGLLGIITSGSGVVTYAEIADILDFADSTTDDLEDKLRFLTSLRVPRQNISPALGQNIPDRLRGRPDLSASPPEIRGGRIYPHEVEAEDLVENLGKAKEIPVEKNRKYEPVPSSYSLTSLKSNSTDGHMSRITRDAEEVREVVMSHYPAIQDCYTQALRTNPNLKGKVVVRFVISPDGKVVDASVVSSNLRDNAMVDCMLSRIRRWNDFSAIDPNAGNIAIKQSYVFGF